MKNIKYSETRRPVAVVGIWNTLTLDCRNPYTVTLWSIAYAGLGHTILDRYFRGFILMIGEIYLNTLSHLNLAIFYTLTKQYALAKDIIDRKALLLYIGVYCFAIFDGYRDTLALNNIYRLADRENAGVKKLVMNSSSFSFLQNISPYVAMVWSAVIPGTGCLMIQRMNRALYLMLLWAVNAYLSGIYTALIYTFAGDYGAAKASLNIQWLLNLPSIWFYGLYETYNCALENNKLCRRELSSFLTREYQNNNFTLADI